MKLPHYKEFPEVSTAPLTMRDAAVATYIYGVNISPELQVHFVGFRIPRKDFEQSMKYHAWRVFGEAF